MLLETYLLEQLAALDAHGSLSAASRQLNLSQPALSRSMRKLEEQLGVALFARTKNHIAMNETGKLAAQHARLILQQQRDMVEAVRAFDRSRHTIAVGGCAPVPLNELLVLLPHYFPGMSIASELGSDAPLLAGLKSGYFHLAVLHEMPTDDAVCLQKCGSERLYLSLPQSHPLAGAKGLYLKELNGRHVLLYANIGFWHDLCREKMPQAKFLIQQERAVFTGLVEASALPSFTTDVLIRRGYAQEGRIHVPILDREADVTYYCACRKEERARFRKLFAALRRAGSKDAPPLAYSL